MTYSFTVRAPDKSKAKAAVLSKVDEVVSQQPVHANDKGQVVAAANGFIDALADSVIGREVVVSVNGYVAGTQVDMGAFEITGAHIGITAAWSEPLKT